VDKSYIDVIVGSPTFFITFICSGIIMKFIGFSTLFVTLTLTAVGCAASTQDGPEADAPAAASDDLTTASTSGTSVLVGTYALHGTTNETPFHSLTLNADHTFKAQGGCPINGPGPHCFAITAISGTWKTKSSPAELELTDSFGQVTDWFYSLKNDQLSLSKSAHGTSSKFDKNLDHLPHLRSMQECADKFGNTLGFCGGDFACLEDTTENTGISRCLPPI
jgi:hypothetical protein